MSEPIAESLAEIAKYETLAEKAYAEMYESHRPAVCYGDFKGYFADAIGAAGRAGLSDEVKRLTDRLNYCRKVYRRQFAGF